MESEIVVNRKWNNDDFAYIKQHNKLIEIVVNPDHNALGSFERDDIKNGAMVYLRGMPGTTYTWQDGKVVDNYGNEVDIETLKTPSLKGKAQSEN